MSLNVCDGTTSKFYRSFVYGLQYIDEIVAQFERSQPTAEVECYLIQDANYTVVAAADRRGDLLQQFGRTPYGTLYAADDDRAHPIDFEHAPERLITPFGHQGLLDDLETGLVYNRARYYRPEIGRFLQRDPNETALIILTALAHNAQAMLVMASVSGDGQYGDGLSLYQYQNGNPFGSLDPLGLRSYAELMTSVGIQGGIGGLINGVICKFAGGSFWSGFASGFIGGALGGGAGYAFAAARFGFVATAVVGGAAEGFVSGASASFYNTHDWRVALSEGLTASAWGAATGVFRLGLRGFAALRALRKARAAAAAGDDVIPPRPPRGSAVGGGFAHGVDADDIMMLNELLGGAGVRPGASVESIVAAATRYTGFWNKTAAMVRQLVAGHVFLDGNKRTASMLIDALVESNGVSTGVSDQAIRRVIHEIAEGVLDDVDEIARRLRGF